MRRPLLIWCLLLAGIFCIAHQERVSAFWQSRDSNYNIAISGGASPTWTGTTSSVNASCGFSNTCSLTLTVSGGLLVVGAGGNNVSGASSNVSAISTTGACGSVSLALATSPSVAATNAMIGLFYGIVSSGSCNLTATSSAPGGWYQMGVAVGTLNNLNSNTPGTPCNNNYNNGGVNPFVCSSPITVSSGGYGIAAFIDVGAFTLGSSNITIDSQTSTGPSIAIGHASAAGSITPSFTSSGGNFGMDSIAAAPWR